MEPITQFRGDYRWLSNFHPCKIHWDGDLYPSTEHAYQAAKTPRFGGGREIFTINRTPPLTCAQAKDLGQTVIKRTDWELVRYDVMYAINLEKFTRHHDLAKKLLDTGNVQLIEGNHWNDTYWGVCNGVGQNKLGIILMTIRVLLWQIKNQT